MIRMHAKVWESSQAWKVTGEGILEEVASALGLRGSVCPFKG